MSITRLKTSCAGAEMKAEPLVVSVAEARETVGVLRPSEGGQEVIVRCIG